MNDDRIRSRVHLAVDEVTKSAAPDPWLAQKVRAQAERKDEEPVRKKLPAGLIIIMAVILLLTAVAAAVTNGFGILDLNEEQAGNEAYREKIMTLGQRWDGEYCSIEINEAVFDGMTMTFTMRIIPKEGADPVYVVPRVKARSNNRELKVYECGGAGTYDEEGFWVPDIMPAIGVDYDRLAAEYAIGENGWEYDVTEDELEWTVSFEILHTDWPIRFMEVDESDGWDPAAFEEAYRNHELLLDTDGRAGELMDAAAPEDEMEETDDWNEYVRDWLTREIFQVKENAVFSFTTDRAALKKAKEPFSMDLPDGYRVILTRLYASMDQVFLTMKVEHADGTEVEEQDEFRWHFMLLSEDAKTACNGIGSSLNETADKLYYSGNYIISNPVNSVILVPVRDEETEVPNEEVWLVEKRQEPVTEEQKQLAVRIELE